MNASDPTPYLVEILERLARIEERLNSERLPAVRDDLSINEFATAIGRSTDFVYDLIHAKVVRPMRGKRPYRIPRSELLLYRRVR